jgi:FkbM family methyltransferase
MLSTRPLSFVLAASDQGTLIVNHLDRHVVSPTAAYGVGHQILQGASFDPSEVALAVTLLKWLRETRGDGVMALDCGANVGVHTISWAREMTQWGRVIAFEAQERIFYALAGNICLNNCFNARAIHAAVGDKDGVLSIPVPNYNRPGSFGSLELIFREGVENIGQTIDYTALEPVRALRLDDLALPRVDFLKIDVEGMELPVLRGAQELVSKYHPYLLIEHIKTNKAALGELLAASGYRTWTSGINTIALPVGDPCVDRIKQN